MNNNNQSTHIAWHPAFVEALQMELKEYKDILEFHPEYQLTSEPLRIDCLVIKKAKDAVIKKNRYPQKLLGHLQNDRNYTVAESSSGIYTVSGDILPIQVIDSRRLSSEDNLWLRNLINKLEYAVIMRVGEEIKRLRTKVRAD